MPANPFVTFTGPLLVGAVLNALLLGLLLFQIYRYQKLFDKDPLWMRGLVYSLLFMDLVQSAMSIHYVWDVLVDKWGQGTMADLTTFPWSSVSILIIGGLVAMEAQFFFIWRIHCLMQVWWVTYIICPLIGATSLLQGISALVAGAFHARNLTLELSELQTIAGRLWLSGSFICDILIAVAMIFVLSEYKRASPTSCTSSLISTLMFRVVETGAITAIVAGVELALFVEYPDNAFHITPAFILSKLYSNAVLANLNARNAKATYSFRIPDSNEVSFRPHETIRRTTIHVQTHVEHEFDTISNRKGIQKPPV